MDLNHMKELVNELNAASNAYYNDGESFMSDLEFDEKLKILSKMEKESGVILPNSPTINVGATAVNKLKKYTHEFPNKSLDKTKDKEDYIAVFHDGDDVVLMPKMDGSTIVGYYQDGRLQTLATRGNAYVGNDITHNAPYIKGLPLSIPYKGKLIVRGEAVMSYSEFNRINESLEGTELYKNPRNLATATIQLLDPKITKTREVQFFGFNLVYIESPIDSILEQSFESRLRYMGKLGFQVTPYWKISVNQLSDYMDLVTTALKQNFSFPTDGLVTCLDNYGYTSTLEGTGHHCHVLAGYAFKWQDTLAQTTLRDIEWSASRTGLLNPVAVFNPVELEGTTVTRASLHNLSYIEEKDIRIGDTITCYKANMIIPQINESLTAKERNTKIIYKSGDIICPKCGHPAIIKTMESGTKLAFCTQDNCSAKMVGKIAHMAERDCLNIVGLSEKKIQFLLDNHYIEDRFDLFDLRNHGHGCGVEKLDGTGPVLEDQPGWEMKSVDNLLNAIDDARETDFVSFIHAMGIPGIGKGQAKLIKKHMEANYDKFVEECYPGNDGSYDLIGLLVAMTYHDYDWSNIDGFGDVLAISLRDWVMENLCDAYVYEVDTEISLLLKELHFNDKRPEAKEMPLIGKTFVITGDVHIYKNRNELQAKIESLGGKASGSVSKNTSYLINNDVTSTSGKNKKAKELGIPIISEEEFEKLIG